MVVGHHRLERVTASGFFALQGGVVYVHAGGAAVFLDCTCFDNYASNYGAVAYAYGGAVDAVGGAFSNNSAILFPTASNEVSIVGHKRLYDITLRSISNRVYFQKLNRLETGCHFVAENLNLRPSRARSSSTLAGRSLSTTRISPQTSPSSTSRASWYHEDSVYITSLRCQTSARVVFESVDC